MGTDRAKESGPKNRRFRTVLFILKWGGFPIYNQTASRLSWICSITCGVFTGLLYASVVMNFIASLGDLKEFVASTRTMTAMATVCWMQIFLSLHKDKVERLLLFAEAFTWEEMPTRDPDTGKLTWAGWIPRIDSLVKYPYVAVFVIHHVQLIGQAIVSREMSFKTWLPYDSTVSPALELSTIGMILASFNPLLVINGFTGLYATLVAIGSSQLEKLKLSLLDITQNRTSVDDSGAKTQMFDNMQKRLHDCIRLHQLISEYLRLLEKTMNINLCGLLLILSIALCFKLVFSCYGIVSQHTINIAQRNGMKNLQDLAEVSQSILFYFLMVSELFVYCYIASELTEEAESVKEAAWGCDWVGTPLPFQRCLVFVIGMAGKGFTLTAGKFVPVSNETMMNIINQSLAFFMVLLTMKEKVEEIETK